MPYTSSQFCSDNFDFNTIAGKDNLLSLEDLKDQQALIEEEVKEIARGLDNNDPVEVLDGLIDVYVVLDGLKQKLENLGFDVEEAARRVAQNNLSKFTDTGFQADKTQFNYKANKGVETIIEYNDVYKKYVIKDTNGKVRKPLGFESVKLSDLVPDDVKGGFKPRVLN